MANVVIQSNERGQVTAVLVNATVSAKEYWLQPPLSPGFGVSGIPVVTGVFVQAIHDNTERAIGFDGAVRGINESPILTEAEKQAALQAIAGFRPGDAIYFRPAEPGVRGVIDEQRTAHFSETIFRIGMAVTVQVDP